MKFSRIVFSVFVLLVVFLFATISLAMTPKKKEGNYKAAVLVDSVLLDSDFDGVLGDADKCPHFPAYQIVRFGLYDSVQYLQSTIQFVGGTSSSFMDFEVDGKVYSVKKTQKTVLSGGFSLRGLFFLNKPKSLTGDEAIVLVQRDDSYNLATGCATQVVN